MSRIAFVALAALVSLLALSDGTASAGYGGSYYYGGGYSQPCCNYAPPPPPQPVPCCAQMPAPAPYYAPQYAPYPIVVPAPQPAVLPPPPLVGLGERGPKYYSGHGYSREAGPCYQQYVRVPDRFGGWAWGLRSGCDTH
jgi:hypothetical protein